MKTTKIIRIFSFVALSVVLAISSSVGVFFLTQQKDNSNLLGANGDIKNFELYKQKIVNDSYVAGVETFYEYDKKVFINEHDLNEYLFNKGGIQSYVTSVNPDKAKIDFNESKLDPDKVFDTNINNYRQVYRDIYGNTRLTLDEALNTYVNDANIVTRYSYDGFQWYLTEYDAKNAGRRQTKVQKSLYYLVNGRYYNAFNTRDIQDLINNMVEGYYIDFDKTLSGNSIEINPGAIFGDKENVSELLKKHFKEDFYKNYWQNLVTLEKYPRLHIALFNNSVIDFADLWGTSNRWNNVYLTFAKNYSSYTEMRDDFLDESKWYRTDKKGYARLFDLIIDGKIKKDVEVHFTNQISTYKRGVGFILSYRPFNFSDIKVSNTNPQGDKRSSGVLTLFKDEEKTIQLGEQIKRTYLNDVYDDDLTNDEMATLYAHWFDGYLNNVVTSFGNNDNREVLWTDIANRNYIANNSKKFKAGKIYKDKAYKVNFEKGYSNSLIQSQKNWELIKEKIKFESRKKGDYVDSDKPYEMLENFYVRESDLDNFLYLEGQVESRVMYSITDEEHPSDPSGRFLAQTEQQAKELKLLFNSDYLKTRHYIEVNGKQYDLDKNNLELSKKNIKSKLNIESKFIHKKEHDKIKSGIRQSWDQLLSSGTYTVYSIPNPYNLGERMFYSTKAAALNALKSNLNTKSSIQSIENKYFIYNLYKNGNILPIRYTEKELDMLVKELYDEDYANLGE